MVCGRPLEGATLCCGSLIHSYEVLRLASESKCSTYDCEFIATANDLKVPLVTSDRQLLQEFPTVAMPLSSFSE